MSFGKAKRFDYKAPDLLVSPADYYICSSLEKACTIPKNERFRHKNEDPGTFTCSRQNCRCKTVGKSSEDFTKFSRSKYIGGPSQSSTPNKHTKNTTDLDKIKEKIINLNEEDMATFSQLNSKKKCPKRQSVKNLIHKYETQNNEVHFWNSEEFIDDDYHSYTSSDDLDRGVLHNNQPKNKKNQRSSFEEAILNKMDKLEGIIGSFQENLNQLHKKVDTSLENYNSEKQKYHYLDNSVYQDHSEDLKYIIFKTIENLRKKFEEHQQGNFRILVEYLSNLISNIKESHQKSSIEIKTQCDDSALNLYNEISECIEKNATLEFEESGHSQELSVDDDNLNFNYENICQVLSDQLQISHRELEELDKKKTDMTVKCGHTMKQLETQSSVIEIIKEKLDEIKQLT